LRIPVQAISFFVLILLAASFSAAIAGPGDDDWEFRLIPYLWFIGSTGELTVNGETADLDAGFSDIWDNLNIVAMGQFEARKGDWTFALDGLYLDLRDRSESWLVKTRSNLRYGIIESFAACRFVSLPLGGGPDPPTLEFEEIFGGRFVYAKSQTDIFPGSGLSDSRWWLDPFIGFRIACRTAGPWTVRLRGDIGGFGIGTASDFTWNFSSALDYRLSTAVSLSAAYRVLAIDNLQGGGDNRSGFNGRIYGPALGVVFCF
jgi:hypothetical protein